jgi:hypothetical protein
MSASKFGEGLKRASTYRASSNTHAIKVDSAMNLIGNPNIGGRNLYEDFTPYSTD